MSFKDDLISLLAKETKLAATDVAQVLSVPPDTKLGDFAFPCFKIATLLKVSPKEAADKLKREVKWPAWISSTAVVGPYLNFYLDKTLLAESVLGEIAKLKDKYGQQNIGKGKSVVIDYSAPNIAKPFGIGHLRSTIIGNCLYKSYKTLGYNVIGVNHLGDWGTQFGKMIVAFRLWGDEKKLHDDPINYLLSLYVKFHAEAEKDDSLNDAGRAAFKALEGGDKEARRMWKQFRDLSLKEFERMYELLGVSFDSFNGEAFYEDKIDAAIKKLQTSVKTETSQGALVVNLEEYGMPPLILRKSDGSTMYHTRDVATAYYRISEYKPSKLLYVVGTPQKLHFDQLFKTMELAGLDPKLFEHVDFGLIRFDNQKFSTRKGNIILLDDVLRKAIEKVEEIIEEKNPDLLDKKSVAKQVGIGAVIFADLHTDRVRNIDFDWDKILSFDGETGPYLQYTHARASSILRKANYSGKEKVDYSLLTSDEAKQTLLQLGKYKETILEVVKNNKPNVLANYLVKLGQQFNDFYVNNKVISDDDYKLMAARLLLVDSVRQVLSNGLRLLGIAAPEEM